MNIVKNSKMRRMSIAKHTTVVETEAKLMVTENGLCDFIEGFSPTRIMGVCDLREDGKIESVNDLEFHYGSKFTEQ